MFYFQHFIICLFIFLLLHLTLTMFLFSLRSLLITFIVPCCKGFFVQLSSFFTTSLHVLFKCFLMIWLYFFYHLTSSVASFDLVFSLYIYFHLCDLFICCNISRILFYFYVFVCFIINVCCNVAILCHHSVLQEGLHLHHFFQLPFRSLCSSSFAAMFSFAPLC